MKTSTLSIAKLVLLIAMIAGGLYYFRFTESGRQITPHRIVETIRSFDALTSRLVYVGIYVVGTVLLLPGTVLSFGGAIIFGAYEGTLLTWIGATIGATLSFLVTKYLGRQFVERLLAGRLDAFEERIRKQGFKGLLIIRLLPIFPFSGVNFGCGLTSITIKDYVLATAIGILPGTFVYQYLFANIGEKILLDGFRWEYLKDPELLTALGLFALFVVIGKLAADRLKRHS